MKKLVPRISLYDIYGPGHIFNPRASYQNMRWLPRLISQHSTTGSLLTIAGKMPILCHSGVTASFCLDILNEAGLQITNNRYLYHDKKSYYETLESFHHTDQKIVINYPHLQEELHPQKYWVDPSLLSYLNNKGNLSKLVPNQNLAKRKVLPISKFLQNKNAAFNLPYVIKAATNEPGGGGLGVVICKNDEDIQHAKDLFHDCDFVVIEDLIPIKQNYCVQFAQTYKGDLIYLGAAEQIINEQGKYGGNWMEREHPPKKVITLGQEIMKKAVSLGYRGIGGIDIVIGEDNRIIVIDLNFRQNGSTGALLLKNSIMKALNVNTLKFKVFKTHVSDDDFQKHIRFYIYKKKLVPLSIYRPLPSNKEQPILVSCILAGNSKKEVLAIEEQLHSIGFY